MVLDLFTVREIPDLGLTARDAGAACSRRAHRGQAGTSPREQRVVLVFALAREPRRRGRALDDWPAQTGRADVVTHDTRAHVVPGREHELLLEAVARVKGERIVLGGRDFVLELGDLVFVRLGRLARVRGQLRSLVHRVS